MSKRTLVLDGPLATVANAHDGSPRGLTDARVRRHGEVTAEREGSEGPEVPGTKPLVRVGDVLLDSALSGLGDSSFHALHAVTRAGDRTVTAVTHGPGAGVRKLASFTDDGAGGVGTDAQVPRVTGVSNSFHRFGMAGTTLSRYPLGYLFVPFNARDEAGDWFYQGSSKLGLQNGGGEIPGSEQAIDWVLTVSADTAYVRVFKTLSYGLWGYARKHATNNALPYGPADSTDQMFYFKTVQAQEEAGVRRVRFRDDVSFWTAQGLTLAGLEEGRVFPGASSTPLNEIVVPTEPLDLPINVHVAGTYGGTTYPGAFEANVLHYAGGRVLCGDVAWWSRPIRATLANDTFVLILNGGPSTGAFNVRVRREYVVGARTVIGPARTFTSVNRLKIPWQGETAIRVYVDEGKGAGYQFYERLVPDGQGAYVTAYLAFAQDGPSGGPTEMGPKPPRYAFSGPSFDADRLQTVTDPDEVAMIEEPLAVFQSAVNRPREVLFGMAFTLPHGDRVRMLAPARLAEAEGLRAYDFYAGSSTGIWAVENHEGYPLSAVTESFGVAVSSLTGRAMYAPVDSGLVVAGTDGRIHLISGRQSVPLDGAVAGLWEEVLDLTYDPVGLGADGGQAKEPLLWALTDTGLWAYSFERQGWVAHRTSDGRFVHYDAEEGLLEGDDGTTSTTVLDGSGDVRETAAVVTQRISETQRVMFHEVKVDFNGGVYDATETATVACAVRHPGVVQVDPIEGAGAGAQDISYTTTPGRPRFPRLPGRGAQVKVTGFEVLRSITMELKPTNQPGF